MFEWDVLNRFLFSLRFFLAMDVIERSSSACSSRMCFGFRAVLIILRVGVMRYLYVPCMVVEIVLSMEAMFMALVLNSLFAQVDSLLGETTGGSLVVLMLQFYGATITGCYS